MFHTLHCQLIGENQSLEGFYKAQGTYVYLNYRDQDRLSWTQYPLSPVDPRELALREA